MQLDYSIEEMLLQSPTLVVYKARGRNGFRYAISRFIYTKSVLSNLQEASFESALTELKRLSHGCLRPVIDGGLDEVDGMPWVARVWWDGDFLDDRMKEGMLSPTDIQRLADHGQALIDALGDRASAVSFKARDVILTTGRGGQPVETFNIDVKNWFRDWAMGMPPGGGSNARAELSKLVMDAENSALIHAAEQQEIAAHQELAIPQPPPTQVIVAPPPPTRTLMTAQGPVGPSVPAPPPTGPLIPAPAPSGPLVPMPVMAGQPGVPAPPPSGPLIPAPVGELGAIPAPPPSGPMIPSQGAIPTPPPSGPLAPMPYADQGAIPTPPPSGPLAPMPYADQGAIPTPPPSGPLAPMPYADQGATPGPAPTGPLIPPPDPTQSLMPGLGPGGQMVPAPTPSQMLVQAPPQNQIPSPPPSQMLVQAPPPNQAVHQGQPPVEGAAPTAANKLLFDRPPQARRLQFR